MDCSNNCSIVLKLTGLGARGFSYLITGDTENARWDTINRFFGGSLKSHVLAAPHHGSKNATHPASLLNIAPHTVLISAGVDSQYGHPDPGALRV
jgi:competence protein ComEC